MFRFIYTLSGFSCAFCAFICALTCGLATLGANRLTIVKYGIGAGVFIVLALCSFTAAARRRRPAL